MNLQGAFDWGRNVSLISRATGDGKCETVSVKSSPTDPCAGYVCPPESPHCIGQNGQAVCVECTRNSHCAADETCQNNSCVSGPGNGNGGGGGDGLTERQMMALAGVGAVGAAWYYKENR